MHNKKTENLIWKDISLHSKYNINKSPNTFMLIINGNNLRKEEEGRRRNPHLTKLLRRMINL